MNLREAIIVILEATSEMSEDPKIRQARKRLGQRAESLRLKRERAVNQTKCGSGIKPGKLGVFFCTELKGHVGPHRAGCLMWDQDGWEKTDKPD